MSIFQKVRQTLINDKMSFVIIAVGIALRLKHYFENNSLWLDEAHVALNLAAKSLPEIAQRHVLFPDLAAPSWGFMVLEKLAVLFFGEQEHVFRLYSITASIVSLFLMRKLVMEFCGKKVTNIALTIFALSEPLVYYAAQVKEYSGDVLIFIILILTWSRYLRREESRAGFLCLALSGVFAMWFSTSSLFVLAGIALLLLYRLFCEKEKIDRKLIVNVFSCWGWSFIVLYCVWLGVMAHNQTLINMWSNFYLPYPVFSFKSLLWAWDSLLMLPSWTAGVSSGLFVIILFLVGCKVVFQHDRIKFYLLFLPILVVFMAACFHRYPFYGRLVLFLSPSITIFIAQGIDGVAAGFTKRENVLRVFLSGILLFSPLQLAWHGLVQGREREDMRTVMAYFQKNYHKGDSVYLNNSAQYSFSFYRGFFRMGRERLLVGKILDDFSGLYPYNIIKLLYFDFDKKGYFEGLAGGGEKQELLKRDLPKFKCNPRTWVILSHFPPDQQKNTVAYLERRGKKLQEQYAKGAVIFLYDLSEPPSGEY